MEITEIIRQKSYFEVHTKCAVYEIDGALLARYDLHEGTQADEDLLDELHTQSRYKRALARANYLLDAREYSYAMLYRKLMQTYKDAPLVKKVLKKLMEIGAVDDRRYAEHLAEYLIERKRYGIFRARQEMLHKGLEKNLVEDALADYDETALENLPEVLEKKYGRYLTDPDDFKAREKVIAGMARLGYNYRDVKDAIEDWFSDWEDGE